MPVPEPRRGEALVRVSAAGICGTDLHIHRWDPWARAHVHPPRVIGHEFTGTVVALGQDVGEVAIGDRIAGECHVACGLCHNCRRGELHICERLEIIGIDRDGAFADYMRMPARNAWRLHDEIPTDVAAVMDPLGNAVHAALATDLAAQVVLITGCGPIGLMAIAVCRMAGAAVVVATDVNPARLSLAATMGADLVLDAAVSDVAASVRGLTDGQGADVVLEMSGHPRGIRDALQAVRRGGRVSLLGLPGSPVDVDLANDVIFKAIRIQGVFGRRIWETWEQMSRLLRRGLEITPVITHRLPLERFGEAFALLESGSAGKVILTIES